MIIAENIHKFYEKNHILKGINLKIEQGEIVSLVGASGAGKTTLLQILGTIDIPEKNQKSKLILKNKKISEFNNDELASFRNQEIGFVFQFHQLLPEFSVIENICIPAFINKTPREIAESRANELINYLGLKNRVNNKPSELSGGEKQRVAVARALINNPSIILADEPSGNLDSTTSNSLHDLFSDLRKDFKYTFVIATHDVSLAKKSDRILKISDGIIN
ncbi:MAG: lipoprotein-releasing system ATP-binding protein LolD [Flavobacteriaceae bacterium]|jgi:lipoprotein-releasing system ATP-binding protein|nr:lipoprotein-releasing system ATP-binding protein LolD [Flavobacteriaceae bacterium]|tara:strand:+ start:39985 stop:40644 length:660 start_codon:yes stop_codon:yes gene_type:complete